MAELSQRLPTEMQGKRIIDAPEAPQSILGGIARAIQVGARGIEESNQNARRRKQDERDDIRWQHYLEDREREQMGLRVRDEAEGVVNRAREMAGAAQASDQEIASNSAFIQDAVMFGGEDAPPAEFVAVGDSLTRLARGMAQGRVSSATYQMELERGISALMRQYPEMRAELATYLQGRGIETSMFRELRLQQALDQNEDENRVVAQDTALKAAINAGVWVEGMPREQGVAWGNQLLRDAAEARAAAEAAEEARKNSSASREETQFRQQQADRAGVNAIISNSQIAVGSAIQQFGLLSANANTDEQEQMLAEQGPRLIAALTTARSTAKQQLTRMNAGTSAHDQVDQYFDQAIKDVEEMVTGNLSRYQTTRRSLETLQTQIGIDVAQAFPMYARLSRVVPKEQLDMILSLDKLPPPVLEALRSEWENPSLPTTQTGRQRLAQLAGVLRNELDIRQLSPEEGRAALQVLNPMTARAAAEIKNGNTGPGYFDAWIKGANQVLNAASAIDVATADPQSIVNATASVFSRDQYIALEEMAKNPTYAQEAREIAYHGRATAMHLLNVSRAQLKPDPAGLWTYQVNGDGQATTVFNRARATEVARTTLARRSAGLSYAEERAGGLGGITNQSEPTQAEINAEVARLERSGAPDNMRRIAAAQNQAVGWLVMTTKYDEDMPQNITPRELRRFYMEGRSIRNQAGEPVKSPDQLFQENVAQFETSLTNLTRDLVTNPETRLQPMNELTPSSAISAFTGAGLSREAAAGIVGNLHWESGGLNTQARNPRDGRDGSDSIGLAQWNSSRANALKEFANAQGKDWHDHNVQLEFILRELQTTERAAYDRLVNAKSPEEAADIFAQYFLRPARDEDGRIHGIDQRRNRARQFYGN